MNIEHISPYELRLYEGFSKIVERIISKKDTHTIP